MPYRKISRVPPELLNIIFKIADKYNVKEVTYTIEFGNDDMDYNSLYKVRVKGHKNCQKVQKAFFIKWHSDPKKRTAFRDAYCREYLFLNDIVPKFLEVQNYFNVIQGLRMKFANCVYATVERGREAIVLADLMKEGYKLQDRFYKLDLDHVALAVKHLAKLHALSFVLEKSQPKGFEEIKESCHTDVQYSDTERMSNYMISYYNTSVEVVKNMALKKKLQNCAPYIPKILNRCAMPNTTYRTICHGDYWNSNVLYKYQNNKPYEVIFVDAQLVRYASPVTDISYYLYMSTDHDFRSQHYDQVLALYYDTLSAVIRQCNLDINSIYPSNIFREHLNKYSVYGLIEALISMKIITAGPEDTIKMTQMKHEVCEEELCTNEFRNRDEFVERVNGVVNDFFSKEYSLDAVLTELQR